MKVTLFIPTKNEIIGCKAIMPRINKNWVDEIIVVDAASTDGTGEWLTENGYNVITQKSTGICGAYWEAIEAATGDIIIAFSPDNNSIPELIPSVVEKAKEGYDMVIVSRYKDGAKSEDDDFVTKIGNWGFTKAVNLIYGGNYTDTLVMFRAFKADLVKRLNMDVKKTPTFEYLLAIRCAKLKLKVAEIPGDEPKRIGGIRKMNPFYNGSTLLWLFFRELIVFKPAKKLNN
jgi:glycosyltransferase involved in cell wall biosynthesis